MLKGLVASKISSFNSCIPATNSQPDNKREIFAFVGALPLGAVVAVILCENSIKFQ